MEWTISENKYESKLHNALIYREAGKITKSQGLIYEAYLPGAAIGSICRILRNSELHSEDGIDAEVVGFKEKRVMLMPYEEMAGINHDSLVVLKQRNSSFKVSRALLGRVLDGRGQPIDGKGPVIHDADVKEKSLYQRPSDPLKRSMIKQPLSLGVKAIDGLITCGKGQRVGIMAGSGVGKSVLLGMMARYTTADINVIALIGERGREVREFLENDLGAEGLQRSVVIVATSDSSPLLRMRGAFLAATIAECFRDDGDDVLMLMDSVTRFCMAQREIGLSLGEPPASKGYTPSVFATLPKLLERAGTGVQGGSVTGLYTVLVEGDDMDDPIADHSRAILDGHIVLTRKLAERNHFPAIDVLSSTSRVMGSVIEKPHKTSAEQLREWLSLYQQVEDLINIGAYVKGSNTKIDQAVSVREKMLDFLRQPREASVKFADTMAQMQAIMATGQSLSNK